MAIERLLTNVLGRVYTRPRANLIYNIATFLQDTRTKVNEVVDAVNAADGGSSTPETVTVTITPTANQWNVANAGGNVFQVPTTGGIIDVRLMAMDNITSKTPTLFTVVAGSGADILPIDGACPASLMLSTPDGIDYYSAPCFPGPGGSPANSSNMVSMYTEQVITNGTFIGPGSIVDVMVVIGPITAP